MGFIREGRFSRQGLDAVLSLWWFSSVLVVKSILLR